MSHPCLVESGEGIESQEGWSSLVVQVQQQWNPVKELKVDRLEKSLDEALKEVESGEGIESTMKFP